MCILETIFTHKDRIKFNVYFLINTTILITIITHLTKEDEYYGKNQTTKENTKGS